MYLHTYGVVKTTINPLLSFFTSQTTDVVLIFGRDTNPFALLPRAH